MISQFSLSRIFMALFLFVISGDATITVTETGRRISSRPDHFVGNHFVDGYEYMARLQYLTESPHLCPRLTPGPPLNITIDIPSDGLPVALLVRSGRCSTDAKAKLASHNIHPPHLVRYLIVSDEMHPTKDWYDEIDTSLLGTRKRHHRSDDDRRDPSVTVGVLHVSEVAGNELRRSVATLDRVGGGGPRIILDGRSSTHRQEFRRAMMWVGISVMMLGCLLSFVLSIQAQRGFVLSEETEHGPPRDVRRRLTMEQVREMLPELIYTGETLVRDEEHGSSSFLQASLTGEVCSICLDEYAPRDRCNCLPCEHTFHSKCVAKWLTERSSTCPLCKTDLLVEENESESGSDYVELEDGSVTDDDSEHRGSSLFSFLFSSTEARWWQRRWQRPRRQDDDAAADDTLSEARGLEQPLLEQQVELSDDQQVEPSDD